MKENYKTWLAAQEYAENTIAAQLNRIAKVEQFYGELDQVFAQNEYDKLINELTYSTQDERCHKPNPSRLVFDGSIRKNLQSYKGAVVRYKDFLENNIKDGAGDVSHPVKLPDSVQTELLVESNRFSLERDMQASLRKNIESLQSGLAIIDDGAERSVSSGFIDILCKDQQGNVVVVELKAGKTDARVVGQILGYMGDVMDEDELTCVKGIIVAHEFDRRTIAAAKVVPNLSLVRYSIAFKFEQQELR